MSDVGEVTLDDEKPKLVAVVPLTLDGGVKQMKRPKSVDTGSPTLEADEKPAKVAKLDNGCHSGTGCTISDAPSATGAGAAAATISNGSLDCGLDEAESTAAYLAAGSPVVGGRLLRRRSPAVAGVKNTDGGAAAAAVGSSVAGPSQSVRTARTGSIANTAAAAAAVTDEAADNEGPIDLSSCNSEKAKRPQDAMASDAGSTALDGTTVDTLTAAAEEADSATPFERQLRIVEKRRAELRNEETALLLLKKLKQNQILLMQQQQTPHRVISGDGAARSIDSVTPRPLPTAAGGGGGGGGGSSMPPRHGFPSAPSAAAVAAPPPPPLVRGAPGTAHGSAVISSVPRPAHGGPVAVPRHPLGHGGILPVKSPALSAPPPLVHMPGGRMPGSQGLLGSGGSGGAMQLPHSPASGYGSAGLQAVSPAVAHSPAAAAAASSPVPPPLQSAAAAASGQHAQPQQSAEQRQQAAKLALRKQLEKTLLQIAPPRPPPPEMNFVPNLASNEFVYLLGLEEIVKGLLGTGSGDRKETPVSGSPFTCAQCTTDYTPVWKREKAAPGRIVCERCMSSNQKKVLKQEHTARLKNAFVRALQREQELELRLASSAAAPDNIAAISPVVSATATPPPAHADRSTGAAASAAAAMASAVVAAPPYSATASTASAATGRSSVAVADRWRQHHQHPVLPPQHRHNHQQQHRHAVHGLPSAHHHPPHHRAASSSAATSHGALVAHAAHVRAAATAAAFQAQAFTSNAYRHHAYGGGPAIGSGRAAAGGVGLTPKPASSAAAAAAASAAAAADLHTQYLLDMINPNPRRSWKT